jgi:tetratricopeptide (TPR) repeat protein
VSLLFNKPSSAFFDFEVTGNVSHDSAIAFRPPSDPSRNKTDIQSTTSPIYKTNNSSPDVSTLVYEATALYNQGNYTKAIQYYDKALAIDPNNKAILDSKADTLVILGNYTQALQYYDKVSTIDPKYGLFGKANALAILGNYTQAIQYYDKALAINPKESSALNGKGDALYSLANDTQGYENAIQYYDKALAIDPYDTNALNGKGNALSGQGNNTQAISYYDSALSIDPKNKVILDNKADTLASLGTTHKQYNTLIRPWL